MSSIDRGDGISRRKVLECMTWTGTGVLWSIAGGVPHSLGIIDEAVAQERTDLTFLQISDSHIGFDKPAGRLDDINGETVAALVYRRRHHVINLFVTRHPGSERARSGSEIRHGFNVRQWTADGLDFWAVSDINAGELDEFYKKFTAAAHPAAPS